MFLAFVWISFNHQHQSGFTESEATSRNDGIEPSVHRGDEDGAIDSSKDSSNDQWSIEQSYGGSLYSMAVVSSADRFREARMSGEPLEATVKDAANSSSAESSNGSVLPLMGDGIWRGRSFRNHGYPEHQSEIMKSLGFASSDWTPAFEKDQVDSIIAKQPVWLQRQR